MNHEEKQISIIVTLDSYWDHINDLQEHYLKHNGKYFQGLASTDTVPNGESEVEIDINQRPTDQDASLSDFLKGMYTEEMEDEHGNILSVCKFLEPNASADDIKLTTQLTINTSTSTSGHEWSVKICYLDDVDGGVFSFTRSSSGNSSEWVKEFQDEGNI